MQISSWCTYFFTSMCMSHRYKKLFALRLFSQLFCATWPGHRACKMHDGEWEAGKLVHASGTTNLFMRLGSGFTYTSCNPHRRRADSRRLQRMGRIHGRGLNFPCSHYVHQICLSKGVRCFLIAACWPRFARNFKAVTT